MAAEWEWEYDPEDSDDSDWEDDEDTSDDEGDAAAEVTPDEESLPQYEEPVSQGDWTDEYFSDVQPSGEELLAEEQPLPEEDYSNLWAGTGYTSDAGMTYAPDRTAYEPQQFQPDAYSMYAAPYTGPLDNGTPTAAPITAAPVTQPASPSDGQYSMYAAPYTGPLDNAQDQRVFTPPQGQVDLTGEGVQQFEIDRSSRTAFMTSFEPAAVQALAAKGYPTSLAPILVSIPINEQGWQQPAPGNNYYGIKGSNPRTGANTGPVGTWESVGGQRVNTQDTFRAYDSPSESVADFLSFLETNPRYAEAVEIGKRTGDPAQFIRAIHRAGYATDPIWSDKILNIAKDVPEIDVASALQPTSGARATSNARLPAGHYDGDGDDHGVAPPYTQRQVDKAGHVWEIAFDYDQPYANPFNPDVPNHRGVDLRVVGVENGGMNMPYTAFRNGTVAHVTRDEHGGIGVIVDTGDPNARYDRYFHNNAVSVKEGDAVVAGETNIGILGQTGTEGFPHLHYEVSQNVNGDPSGQTIDPRPYMSIPGQATPSQRAAVTNPAPPTELLQTPYTSGKRPQTTGVVIHSTQGPGVTPEAEYTQTLDHFRQNGQQVSANAVIGADGRIALVPDWDAVTHHAGENNGTNYGIELVQSAADAAAHKPYTDAQYASLQWLLGEVSQRYGLPLNRQTVVGHQELAQGQRQGKSDPGEQFDWARALAPRAAPVVAAAAQPARPATPAQPGAAAQPAAPARTFTAPPQQPGATYTLDNKPVSYDQYAKAVVQQQESRQKFLDSLPAPTQQAYTQWEAFRRSRNESTADMDEFGAHLDRIGAPNPFREDRENRQKFIASLPEPTQKAFTEWEAYRKANGQPTDMKEFEAHLDRLGAPNPWREERETVVASKARHEAWLATLPPTTAKAVPEWQAARVAKGEDPNDQKALSDYLDYQGIENPFKPRPATAAPGQAAAVPGRTVYTVKNPDGSTREITEAQANEINAQNAALNRINAAHNERVAGAQVERGRLQTWQQQSDAYFNDPNGQLPHPGPRPATPNLDYLEAQAAAGQDTGAREQPIRVVSSYNEPSSATETATARTLAEARVQTGVLSREATVSTNPLVQQAVAATQRGAELRQHTERFEQAQLANYEQHAAAAAVDPEAAATLGPRPATPLLDAQRERQIQAETTALANYEQRAAAAAVDPEAASTLGPRPATPTLEAMQQERYRRQSQAAAVDPEAASILGPRPATPTLDLQRVRQIQAEEARLARYEQHAAAAAVDPEAASTLGARPATPLLDAQRRQDAQTLRNRAAQSPVYGPYQPGWLTGTSTPARGPAPAEIVAERQARERGWVPGAVPEVTRPGAVIPGSNWLQPALATPEGRAQMGREVTASGERSLANINDTISSAANFGGAYLERLTENEPLVPGSYRAQVRAGGAGVAQPIKEYLDDVGPSMQQWANQLRADSEERQRAYQEMGYDIVRPPDRPLDLNNPAHLAAMTFESAPILIAGMAVGTGVALTAGMLGAPLIAAGLAGSTASAALMFGVEGGQAYQQARDQGLDRNRALQVGAVVGTVNAVLEEFGPLKWVPDSVKGALTKGFMGQLAKGPAVRLIARGLEGGTEEGLEEVAQTISSNIAAAAYDPNQSIFEGVAEGGVGGFVPGLFLGSTGQAIRDVTRARRQVLTEALQPQAAPDAPWQLEPGTSPGERLAREGVVVQPIAADFSSFAVRKKDPNGEGISSFTVTRTPDGLVIGPAYAGQPIPETPLQSVRQGVQAVRRIAEVYDFLAEREEMSSEAAQEAALSFHNLVSGALAANQPEGGQPRLGLRPSFTPQNAAEARAAEAQGKAIEGVDKTQPHAYEPPERWDSYGQVPGTNLAVRVASNLPQKPVVRLVNHEVTRVVGTMLGGMSDNLDQYGQELLLLPKTDARRRLALVLGSMGIDALNDNLGEIDKQTGISTQGGIHYDPLMTIQDALADMVRDGVNLDHPEFDLRFPRYVAAKLVKVGSHETTHDIRKGHDDIFDEAHALFTRALAAEKAGILPTIVDLHQRGALLEALSIYHEAMAGDGIPIAEGGKVGAQTQYWKDYGAKYGPIVAEHAARLAQQHAARRSGGGSAAVRGPGPGGVPTPGSDNGVAVSQDGGVGGGATGGGQAAPAAALGGRPTSGVPGVAQGPSAMVANAGPALAAITGEIEKMEAQRADHQTRVGQRDNWGFDYAAREVKTLSEQIERRQRVRAQMAERTQFDFPGVEPRVLVPAEAGAGVQDNTDWNSGGALRWSQPNGATVRGLPIDVDDPRVPNTLYHATTNLPGVQATGMLRAGGVGGLGGDAADNMVSMTTSREIAEGIARDLRTAATISRIPTPLVTETQSRTMSNGETYEYETSEWTSPEAGQEYQAQVVGALQQQARAEGWEYAPQYVSEHSRSGDLLRDYFSVRSYQAGIKNPVLMTDQETLARIDPAQVGVLEIPRDALRTGALLTDFDLGRRGLEEIRSYGDVPLTGGVPLRAGPSAMVSGEAARLSGVPLEMPDHPDFQRALAASPFARMTADGLEIDLERWQHVNQAEEESVRGGVFYLPRRRTRSPYRGMSPAGYGGTEQILGPSTFRRPLFIRGGTGGGAVEKAYDSLKGRGAFKQMWWDIIQGVPGRYRVPDDNERAIHIANFLSRYGGNPDVAWEIVANHGITGNRENTAIAEQIVGAAIRDAGYDSMLGYWVPRGRWNRPPVFTEIFDVRERTYPDEQGRTQLHERFRPEPGREYQAPLPSFMQAQEPPPLIITDQRGGRESDVQAMIDRAAMRQRVQESATLHGRAGQLAAANGGTRSMGAALSDAIQSAIAMFGPTTDNVRSLMQTLGQGDPDAAPLLVKQARGDTSYREGGLADLLVRHMAGEPTSPQGPAPQAPSGYELRDGQLVHIGTGGGTAGYRFEEGRPVYQGDQSEYQVRDGRPVYGPSLVSPAGQSIHPDVPVVQGPFETDEEIERLLRLDSEEGIRLGRGDVRQLTRAALGDPERSRDYFNAGAAASMSNGRLIIGGADIPRGVVQRAAERASYEVLDNALEKAYMRLQEHAVARGLVSEPGSYGGLTFSHDVAGYNVFTAGRRAYIGLWTSALQGISRGNTPALREELLATMAHELAHNDNPTHDEAHGDKTKELEALANELGLSNQLRKPMYQWQQMGGWKDLIRDSGAAYGVTRQGVTPEGRGMIGRSQVERVQAAERARAAYQAENPWMRELATRWHLDLNADDLVEQIEETGDLISLDLLDREGQGDREYGRQYRDSMSMEARQARREGFARQEIGTLRQAGETDDAIVDRMLDYGYEPERISTMLDEEPRAPAPSGMAAQEPPELAAQRLEADLTHPELHADIAQRANAVLADWQQDEDGYDDVYGGGGVCDQISLEIADAIYARHDDINIIDGGQDGDDHAYPIAYRNGAAFAVDIPPGVYETGNGYTWTKIPGAEIRPEHVVVEEVPYEYLGIEDDEAGPSAMEAQEPPDLSPAQITTYQRIALAARTPGGIENLPDDLRARVAFIPFSVPVKKTKRVETVQLPHYVPPDPQSDDPNSFDPDQRRWIPLQMDSPGSGEGTPRKLAYNRAISDYGGYQRFPNGRFRDAAGRLVKFDSSLELALMPELDRMKADPDENLSEWWRGDRDSLPKGLKHLSRMTYRDEQGRPRVHSPDFIIQRMNGDIEAWEVKPLGSLLWPRGGGSDPTVRALGVIPFLARQKLGPAKKGVKYRFITEDDVADLVPEGITPRDSTPRPTFGAIEGVDYRDGPVLDERPLYVPGGLGASLGRGIGDLINRVSEEALALSPDAHAARMRSAMDEVHTRRDDGVREMAKNAAARKQAGLRRKAARAQRALASAGPRRRARWSPYLTSLSPELATGISRYLAGWPVAHAAHGIPMHEATFRWVLKNRAVPMRPVGGSRGNWHFDSQAQVWVEGPSAEAQARRYELDQPTGRWEDVGPEETVAEAPAPPAEAAQRELPARPIRGRLPPRAVPSAEHVGWVNEYLNGRSVEDIAAAHGVQVREVRRPLRDWGVPSQAEVGVTGEPRQFAYTSGDEPGTARWEDVTGQPTGPSAMQSQEPPSLNIAGVTGYRASMTREGQAEDKIVAQNLQTIRDAYSGDMAMIDVKELVQNMVDASRDTPGAKAKIAIFSPDHRIWAIDQGLGMSSSVVQNEFTEYKGTFKPSAYNTGGKGTAKSAILGRSQRIEMRTVTLITPTTGGPLSEMAERANVITFDPSTGTLTLSDDHGYSNFHEQAGLASVELYDIIGEPLTEALMATPLISGLPHTLYGDDLVAAKAAAREAVPDPNAEPYYEETILWGNGDDYLRPSAGLPILSGPFGWVDQAEADGQLGQQFTDPMLAQTWERDIDGNPRTGTRISVVVDPAAQWQQPTGDPQRPSEVEAWMNNFIASNQIQGQTVEFVVDGAEYSGAPVSARDLATTFIATDSGPTYDVDFYASDVTRSDNYVQVDVQNHGLFQFSIYVHLGRAVQLPARLTANVRSKVGAKDVGYPWSGDRTQLIAGAKQTVEGYVQGDLMGAVLARERQAMEQAIDDAIDLPEGDGKLFNVGRVTGAPLAEIQAIAARPYMAILNRGFTRLHNELARMLTGKSWAFGQRSATFGTSSFGGFGFSGSWQGLNVGIRHLTTAYGTDNMLLYDPWNLLDTATLYATEQGIPLTESATGQQAGPALSPAASRARGMDNVDGVLEWDPNAGITVVWNDHETGALNRNTLAPERLLGDVRYRQGVLRNEAENPGSHSDRDVAEARAFLAGAGPTARDYLTLLTEHLAARVLVDGRPQELVDPYYPSVEPRNEADRDALAPTAYLDEESVDALLATVHRNEEYVANAPDEGTRRHLTSSLERARRIYEFNAAVEERIWEVALAAGNPPTEALPSGFTLTRANGIPYNVDQEGVNILGRHTAATARLRDEAIQDNPDSYTAKIYTQDTERMQSVLDRIERVTGLVPTVRGAQVRGRGPLADAVTSGAPWTDLFIRAYAMGILGTNQHEHSHNGVHAHDELFSSFLSAVNAVTGTEEMRAIAREMVQELADSGGLAALIGDMAAHGRIISADNIFEKSSIEEKTLDPDDWPADPREPPVDSGAMGRLESLPDDVQGGGQPERRALPGGIPEDGRAGGIQPEQHVRLRDLGQGELAEDVRAVPGGLGGVAGPAGYASARLGRSPTLQAVAAESAANLRDALERAYLTDPLYGPPADETDRRVIDGFARFYTDAVVGLASNDAEALDQVGLTPAQAAIERERALDHLARTNETQALYEAEAAWATLSGPAGTAPSAMESQEPPSLAPAFYSQLEQSAARLPKALTGRPEVVHPAVRQPDQVVRPASTIREGQTPKHPVVVAENGDWVRPGREISPERREPGVTPSEGAIELLRQWGVKDEELVWTGLLSWLGQQGDRPLTRDEIVEYAKANPVQVQERLLSERGAERDMVIDITPGYEEEHEGGIITTDWSASNLSEASEYLSYQVTYDPDEDSYTIARWDGDDQGYVEVEVLYDEDGVEDALHEDARERFASLPVRQGAVTGPTQYEPDQYPDLVLPGGREYKELVLTLPESASSLAANAATAALEDEVKALGLPTNTTNHRILEAGGSQDLADRWLKYKLHGDVGVPYTDYTGSHWEGIPNAVVHVRFDVRTDAQGNRILFIQEIQSDWHQTGSKKGYRTAVTNPEVTRLVAEYEEMEAKRDAATDEDDELPRLKAASEQAYQERNRADQALQAWRREINESNTDLLGQYNAAVDADDRARQRGTEAEIAATWRERLRLSEAMEAERLRVARDGQDANDRFREADREWFSIGNAVRQREIELQRPYSERISQLNYELEDLDRAEARKVPDAPYKGPEAWLGLALRRMIRYAAENGFDRIAWTTGDQQNARYDVARYADSLAYEPERQRLLIVSTDGDMREREVKPENLGEWIGPGTAKALLATPQNAEGWHELDKLGGLEVGQLGAFRRRYDEQLPKLARDLGEPWGAQTTTVPLPAAESVYGGDGERHFVREGADGWYVINGLATTIAGPFTTREEADLALGGGGGPKVHAFDIPPGLQQIAQERGMPSFMESQEPPDLAPAAGMAPALADPFYSRLNQVAAGSLPDEIEGRAEVREPGRSVPERVTRRAAQNPRRDPPPEGQLMRENGDWYQPARTLPDVIVTPAATPGQRAMELLREGGAKEDEIAWTGVESWLLAKGDAPVTSKEIQDYLSQRKIVIEETLRGGGTPEVRIRYPSERNWEVFEPEPEMIEEGYEDEDGNQVEPEYWTPDEEEWNRQFTMRAISESEDEDRDEYEYLVLGSHINGWQVEDDEGEIVSNDTGGQYHSSIAEVERNVEAHAQDRFAATRRPGGVEGPAAYGPETYPDLTLEGPGRETHRELLLRLPQEKQGVPIGQFTEGHWNQPNVALHVRFTERTDPQGNRLLLIEELQTDWQQKGRTQGFLPVTGLPRGYRLERRVRGGPSYSFDWNAPIVTGTQTDDRTGDWLDPVEYAVGTPEHTAYVNQYTALYAVGEGQPDAGPFEDEQQAVKIMRQRYRPSPKGPPVPEMPFERTQTIINLGLRRMIRYAAENGFDQIGWTRGDVHDIRYPDPTRPVGAFQKFYDQMVVEMANDLGKAWDVQVGSTEIDTGNMGYPYAQHHEGRIAVRDGNDELIEVFDTQEEAWKYIQDNQAGLMAGGERVHVLPIPAQMKRSALEQGMPLFMASQEPPELSGAMPLWDERDEVPDDDPAVLTARAAQAAQAEIENPDSPGLTDSPAQVAAMEGIDLGPPAEGPSEDRINEILAEVNRRITEGAQAAPPEEPAAAAPPPPPPPGPPTAPPPNVGPPEDGEPNLDQFPEWAGGMMMLGDNTTEASPPPIDADLMAEIRAAVELGPNAASLSEAERNALTYAIAWQYNRVQTAASRWDPQGGMTPWAVAQMVDEARRFAALRALATTPRESWGALESVWKSGPISEAEGNTMSEFLQRRRAGTPAPGDDVLEEALQRDAVARLAARLSDSEQRFVGRRARRAAARVTGGNGAADDANRVRRYGDVLAGAIRSPHATPASVAEAAGDADLSINLWEVAQNARYNGVLFGSRGILIDYLSDLGQFFGKMFVDPVRPRQGGLDPNARIVITAVQYASLKRTVPLMIRRMGQVLLTGVSHTEADVSGVPRTVSGKLTRRIANRQSDLGLTGRRRVGGRRFGVDVPINPRGRGATVWGNLNPKLNVERGSKALSIGFLELAGRLKAMADVGIKELAYGMDMSGQAAIMAWKEGKPVDSEEFHKRVAEILAGNINPNARTVDEKRASKAAYQDMHNKAIREAERTTFQGDMGTVGRMIEPLHKHPLGQYVVMFLRTLYHIRGLGIDLTPLGLAATVGDVARAGAYRGLARTKGGQRFLEGSHNAGLLLGGPYQTAWSGMGVGKGVSDLDRRLITNMAGSMAFFYAMGLVFEELVSGAGPPDDPVVWLEEQKPDFERINLKKAMMDDGWQPYSVKVNGKWYSYQNWGPLAYMLAAAAAIGEGYKYGVPVGKQRQRNMNNYLLAGVQVPGSGRLVGGAQGLYDFATQGDQETFKNAGRRFFAMASDISFMRGFVDLNKLVQTIGVKGMGWAWNAPKGETPSDKIKREREAWEATYDFGANIATTYLPAVGLIRQLAATQDPYMRATNPGFWREDFAMAIPNLGPPLPPGASLPVGLPGLFADPYGSTSGRRSGLPIMHDSLGRPIANQYEGLVGWLPVRASRETIASPILDAMIAAGVGPSSPPKEAYYKIEGTPAALYVLMPQSARQEMAVMMGNEVNKQIGALLAQVPESQRQADPEGWKKQMSKVLGDIWKDADENWVKADPAHKALLAKLAADSARTRPVYSKATTEAMLAGLEPDPNAPPSTPTSGAGAPRATPQPTAPGTTPRPSTTPRPGTPGPTSTPRSAAPQGPSQAEIDAARLRGQPTPTGPSAPQPTVTRPGTPSSGPPATPRPAAPAPGGKTQAEIDRERLRGTPVGVP